MSDHNKVQCACGGVKSKRANMCHGCDNLRRRGGPAPLREKDGCRCGGLKARRAAMCKECDTRRRRAALMESTPASRSRERMRKLAERCNMLAAMVDAYRLSTTARGEIYAANEIIEGINEAVPDDALVPGWLQRVVSAKVGEYERFVAARKRS